MCVFFPSVGENEREREKERKWKGEREQEQISNFCLRVNRLIDHQLARPECTAPLVPFGGAIVLSARK